MLYNQHKNKAIIIIMIRMNASYHHRRNFVGPMPMYQYIPCYKLMSVAYNDMSYQC